MKTVSTFSVILVCRPVKNKINEGLIYARISVNGEQKEISLKEKVQVSQWNADKQQVEGRTPKIKALNTHLDNVLFKIKEKYRSFMDKEFPVTAQGTKDEYHKCLKPWQEMCGGVKMTANELIGLIPKHIFREPGAETKVDHQVKKLTGRSCSG